MQSPLTGLCRSHLQQALPEGKQLVWPPDRLRIHVTDQVVQAEQGMCLCRLKPGIGVQREDIMSFLTVCVIYLELKVLHIQQCVYTITVI